MSRYKCSCGSQKVLETITGGMNQVVLWDGDYIVSETTEYEKSTRHSSYKCADCGAELEG
jgi:hypothetical protein